MIEIGVFGGTFNPIHNSTICIAREALAQFNLERIIFVPNGRPPHKSNGLLDKELRFQMLSSAIAGETRFLASRLELDRPGLSWSIDTLEELKNTYAEPHYRLNFIIGEDNVASFERYERKAEFFKLCRLLVAARDTPGRSSLADWQKRLPEAELAELRHSADTISSSLIRDLISRQEPFEHLLPEPVSSIIKAKGHYGYLKKTAPSAA